MRVVALWYPDWPAHAARLEAAAQAEKHGAAPRVGHFSPVAIVHNNRVLVANAAARRQGVRRDMRGRHALSVCPELVLFDHDEQRDARLFDPIVQGLDEVAASVEIVRPGLAVVAWDPLVKFYGGEKRAMMRLTDAASVPGVDTCVGVAPEIPTAMLAARYQHIIAPDEDSREFLAPIPLGLVCAEQALQCDPEVVDALIAVGVRTLGDVAELPAKAVATRFGAAGMHIVRIACARDGRKVAPALPEPERVVRVEPPEPFSRVDEAAFCARTVGDRLARALRSRGLVCQRLSIAVEFFDPNSGVRQWLTRSWHTRAAVDERMIAERVRWQLDAWLSGGGRGLVTAVEVDPVECVVADDGVLWDEGSAKAEAARDVAIRLQAQLGVDKVLQPVATGGRSPLERIDLIPYGDQPDSLTVGGWSGVLPGPHPARRGGGPSHPAARIAVLDAQGNPVRVERDVVLSAPPVAVAWGQSRCEVTGWAGPWPVEEAWWEPERCDGAAAVPAEVPAGASRVVVHDAARATASAGCAPDLGGALAREVRGARCARLQVVGRDEQGAPRAWLLVWWRQRWRVEATYD
ncbi:Y-family DNA polymerase [Corynebacterium aquilae]|uniref:UmuC domain-containing protein n=1 Tax=Corynebacterium aquilae DSM 44791 TaxID=1431546 RepID=A0A1L7CEA5_9CORY|nr:DNA polymerase Y family protein [Corynebacterium aquilae]APT84103.1 hypothetical protein CAQU_02350 [Corynebacterium aquilae DSM 44791]